MKRYLLFLFFTIFISLTAFCESENPWIYVVVTSTDKTISDELPEIRSLMNQELNKTKNYRVRLTIPNGTDPLSMARADELSANIKSSDFNPNEIVEFGELAGANQLCVVEVRKRNNNYYSLSIDIFETEKGKLITNDFYPNADYPKDTPIKNLNDTGAIQRACRYMIGRMELGGTTYEDIKKDEDRDKNTANGKALAWSIIPGVGLMQKGHAAEGIAYLVGDIALVGGGVGMLTYANTQLNLLDSGRTMSSSQYKQQQSKYNSIKTAGYCSFGAAIILYAVNLVRGYKAEAKSGSKLYIDVYQSMTPSTPYCPNISFNLALTYKF